MGILTQKEILFIEFENLLFDVDTFVIDAIYHIFKDNRQNCVLGKLLDKIERNGEDLMQYIGQVKHNENPLIEYLDPEIQYGPDAEAVANEIYYSILYAEYPDCTPYIERLNLTKIGKTIEPLLLDGNLDHLYIYCKNPTEAICEFIFSWVSNDDRVEIITGDIGDFLTSVECTTYFLSDYRNLDYLRATSPRELTCEVMVPEFSYNMASEKKLKPLPFSLTELLEKWNIEVCSLELPMVE